MAPFYPAALMDCSAATTPVRHVQDSEGPIRRGCRVRPIKPSKVIRGKACRVACTRPSAPSRDHSRATQWKQGKQALRAAACPVPNPLMWARQVNAGTQTTHTVEAIGNGGTQERVERPAMPAGRGSGALCPGLFTITWTAARTDDANGRPRRIGINGPQTRWEGNKVRNLRDVVRKSRRNHAMHEVRPRHSDGCSLPIAVAVRSAGRHPSIWLHELLHPLLRVEFGRAT